MASQPLHGVYFAFSAALCCVGPLATCASADVVVRTSGVAEVRFTEWEEFPTGQPFGAEGITFVNNHPGLGTSQGAPPENIVALIGQGSGSFGDPGEHAPVPGTGWDASTMFDFRLIGPAWIAGDTSSMLQLYFHNATAGLSGYVVRGTVSVAMEIETAGAAWPQSLAVASGNVSVVQRTNQGITYVSGVALGSGTYGPGIHHAQMLNVPFELNIPALPDGFAHLTVNFSLMGSAFVVPAPGASLLPLSIGVISLRRRR